MALPRGSSFSVHIKITVQENLPSLCGNSLRFRQVFQNLIQNAIKDSDKKKEVIKIGVIEKDEYFEFFVKDNGIVIKSDYFDKIFKVFTKLESTSASSGIGLYIVKKIVTYYRSSIWLESKESVGTTFYFSLPKQQFTFPLFKEI
jgi:signal transduction histidine kinase